MASSSKQSGDQKPKQILETPRKAPLDKHPWQDTVKYEHLDKIVQAHNSIRNPLYPKPKELLKDSESTTFTVLGNQITKEFIYCVKMVQAMHKYRPRTFAPPIIRGYTGVLWPHILNKLRLQYGEQAACLRGQVAVLQNGSVLGGQMELKKLIESKYMYRKAINYQKESIEAFRSFVKYKTCVYMHICIGEMPIGCLIFMLYTEICPRTCENFMRLCGTKKGGYSGTPVHRIVEDGWIQCGGFALKDTPLGCENFEILHDRRGVLGMCNAGRDIDCSTQFFVLLQPATWMQNKYVAFGQLIDGEETLQLIEQEPTFYESPIENIIVYKTGILNMEYDDVKLNREAVAYIDAHIEELVSLGEMLSEWLIELVNLEILSRYPERLGKPVETADNVSEEGGMGLKDIRATERFMRKKEDIRSAVRFATAVHRHSSESQKNNDTENLKHVLQEFEGEDYDYNMVPSNSIETKEKIPYYIPLTDVPYPEEIDSNFDLRRLLQGNYCLPDDLDPDQPKHIRRRPKDEKNRTLSNYYSWSDSDVESIISGSSDESLNPYDKEEIEDYLRYNVENVSYSGSVVRAIGRKFMKQNPLKETDKKGVISDEELRRLRTTNVHAEPKDSSFTQLKRRFTSFAKVRTASRVANKDEEKAARRVTRRVSIQMPEKTSVDSSNPPRRSRRSSTMDRGRQYKRSTLLLVPEFPDNARRRQSALDRLFAEVDVDSTAPKPKPKERASKVNIERGHISIYGPDSKEINTSLSSFRSTSTRFSIRPSTRASTKSTQVDAYKMQNLLYAQKNKEDLGNKEELFKERASRIATFGSKEKNVGSDATIRPVSFVRRRPKHEQKVQEANRKQEELRKLREMIEKRFGKKYDTRLRLPGDTPIYNLSLDEGVMNP